MLRKKEKEHKLEKKESFSLSITVVFFIFSLLLSAYAQESQYKDLDSIEKDIFHQSFTSESKEDRLSRLEEFLFGTKRSNENPEIRTNKIINALKQKETTTKTQEQITQKEIIPNLPKNNKIDLTSQKEQTTKFYDESTNVGVIGAISQIETKVFGKSFNELSFQSRVSALEEKILTKSEIINNKNKPILERVSYLVKKTGLNIPEQNLPTITLPSNNQNKPSTKIYSVDPKTGFVINDKTGEIVKDSLGNQIIVMLSQPQPNTGFQYRQNQLNQYLNPPSYGSGSESGNPQLQQYGIPGQLPSLDNLLNQDGQDYGQDPGY